MKKTSVRITITLPNGVNERFDKISQRYCISKASWIVQAALEKLEKIENEIQKLDMEVNKDNND